MFYLTGNLTLEISDLRWLYMTSSSYLSKYAVILSCLQFEGGWSSSLWCSTDEVSYGVLCPVLRTRRTWSSLRAPEVFKGLEHCSYKERLTLYGLLSWEKKKAVAQLGKKEKSQGDLFSIYNSLMGWNEDEEVKLFSVVPADRKRGNGYKLKHIKFYLITRKHFFFTMKMIKTRTYCPESAYRPICGDSQNPSGFSSKQPVLADPAWADRLD